MSTNNLGLTSPSTPEPVLAGLPDPATLAQWANALFAALPGRPTVPGTAADPQAVPPTPALDTTQSVSPEGEFESLPVAPYASPTSGFSPPSDADLRAAPASLASGAGATGPAPAAAPPEAGVPYFLDPAQPGVPGTAVGLGPAVATRAESGSVSPSPPSAFAQPAEPRPSSLPASLDSAAAASLAYGFRPELVAAEPAAGAPGGGATPPAAIPLDAPVAGVTQNAADTPAPGGVAVPNESVPLASAQPPTGAPLYFLDTAGTSPLSAEPDFGLDLTSLPIGLADLDLGLDGRRAAVQTAPASDVSALPSSTPAVPQTPSGIPA